MQQVRLLGVLVGILSVLPCAAIRAADWPQYRGPDQTGSSAEKVNLNWPTSGPNVLWKVATQNGFSSFAVTGGMALTQVNRELNGQAREICLALDAATGKELWFADIDEGKYPPGGDAGAKGNSGGDGPRCTPNVSDGRVYLFTQSLVLHCLDARSGKSLWTKDLIEEHAGRNIGWKSGASAVVDGDLVFVAGGGPGQSLLGIDKATGRVAWKAHDERMTHSTPVVATICGQRQVIFYLQSGLLAVSPQDGKAFWRFPMKYRVSTAATPVVSGDIVYCSAGYGVGGAACKIAKQGDGFAVTELWRIPGDRQVPNLWSTPACKDGHLYGMFSFKKFGTGPLKCVELATGKVNWEQPGFGGGNVILVNDKVLALADDGHLVVVQADPAAYREVARAKVVTGKCWSPPALSDGRIYVRSTKEGVCLDAR